MRSRFAECNRRGFALMYPGTPSTGHQGVKVALLKSWEKPPADSGQLRASMRCTCQPECATGNIMSPKTTDWFGTCACLRMALQPLRSPKPTWATGHSLTTSFFVGFPGASPS